MISYKIKGLNRFIRNLKTKPQKARRAVDAELRRSSLRIERGAKLKAPVRTGFMRNGIFMERVGEMSYKVTSPAGYSVYVELGTRRMRAQPFMAPAIQEEYPVLMGRLKKMFIRG